MSHDRSEVVSRSITELSTEPRNSSESIIPLGKLRKGQKGTIAQVGDGGSNSRLTKRFLEMGFVEGSAVEVVHEAPFGGDPFAVRVRGSLVALRRHEANSIGVYPL